MSMRFQPLTSSAAQDLGAQVEGVSELHGDDAQVASSDQATEPAGHGGPAHHPHLKKLQCERGGGLYPHENLKISYCFTE